MKRKKNTGAPSTDDSLPALFDLKSYYVEPTGEYVPDSSWDRINSDATIDNSALIDASELTDSLPSLFPLDVFTGDGGIKYVPVPAWDKYNSDATGGEPTPKPASELRNGWIVIEESRPVQPLSSIPLDNWTEAAIRSISNSDAGDGESIPKPASECPKICDAGVEPVNGWVGVYTPKGTAKGEFKYFRYGYRDNNGRVRYAHLRGGNVGSAAAQQRALAVRDAIARGLTVAEILRDYIR